METGDRQLPQRRFSVDSRILAAYAAFLFMFILAAAFALIPAKSGARTTGAYAVLSVCIAVMDAGIALIAVVGRHAMTEQRLRAGLCVLAAVLIVLSAAQAVLCVVLPALEEGWANRVLGNPNFRPLGSIFLGLLAVVSRGPRRDGCHEKPRQGSAG